MTKRKKKKREKTPRVLGDLRVSWERWVSFNKEVVSVLSSSMDWDRKSKFRFLTLGWYSTVKEKGCKAIVHLMILALSVWAIRSHRNGV